MDDKRTVDFEINEKIRSDAIEEYIDKRRSVRRNLRSVHLKKPICS